MIIYRIISYWNDGEIVIKAFGSKVDEIITDMLFGKNDTVGFELLENKIICYINGTISAEIELSEKDKELTFYPAMDVCSFETEVVIKIS